MPTCEAPGCPGHLGKYPDCVAEALTELSMDGGDESTGDVDWGGYYTLLVPETDEDVTIDPDGEARTAHSQGGEMIMDDDRPCPRGRSHTAAEHRYDPEREAAQARAEDIANGLVEDEPDRSVVQMHSDMGREPHPAVNIKVNKGPDSVPLPLELGGVADLLPDGGTSEVRTVTTDPRFTLEWIDEHLTESKRNGWWEQTCEDHFQQARELAQETFGAHVKVWQEGRSGGWLIVEGLGDVEEWTSEEVARWVAFAEQVRAIADDVPYGYLWSINANVFEPWLEESDSDDELSPDICGLPTTATTDPGSTV